MKLTDSDIEDLRLVLQAAREHIRINEPEDMNTGAAILSLQQKIEEHENG